MSKAPIKSRFELFYHSLRGKFIIAAIILASVLILSSAAAHLYIKQSSSEVTLALKHRINKLKETRAIMDNIWDVSFFLEEHSMAPSSGTADLIFKKLRTSTEKLSYLMMLENEHQHSLQTLQFIADDLSQLDKYINHLVKLRAEPAKLYPAIEVSRSTMFESQSLFSHLVGMSIDEAVESLDSSGPEALILLMDLRYKWSQLISFYRMYLVNRLALLDEEILIVQIGNVDLYLESIKDIINALKQLDDQGNLEFQAAEAMPSLERTANSWRESFDKIVLADTPDEWRSDFPIIINSVAPLMKNIWNNINAYDGSIEQDVKKSLLDLSNVAGNTSTLLWGLTAGGLCILLLIFYFIHNTLLKPIQKLSVAMRNEARDGRFLKPLLINSKSQEIEDLIDAFSIMQLQVHSRKSDLEYQALHDNLTSLPNRLLLFDRLQHTISSAKRNKIPMALIMMDLDRFKEINDTLGHQAGDELLQKVSNRLVECLREADTVARLGGDEFAIVIPECDKEQSKNVALKIRECMQPALMVNEQSLYVHGSLGIANYPEHGTEADVLLKNADIAMYAAKKNNSIYEVYSYEQDMHSLNKLKLKYKLEKAIQNDELELYYQPQLNCIDREVVGIEALLRWNSKEDGLITPDEFIPLAEESGLIKYLTEWVITEAIRQQSCWHKENINIHISVNLSAWNLLDPDLDDFVIKQFKEYDLNTDCVSFEITESAMMQDAEQALKMMRSLNKNGFDLIIDDYGTGFSSLAYLKRFPVKELKIDKSFVINMIENENDAVIVKSTIDLAHNLDLQVIAEGVETREVFELLRILGCDMAQGYFIERPVPAEKLIQWYQSYQPDDILEVNTL